MTYRLPTEAEWEYACRAGTTTLYSFGDDSNELLKYGWHSKNGPHESHPVGTRLANPFGLFDMHGNLSEWCDDWSHEKWYETSGSPSGLSVDPVGPPTGTRRVLRGGSHNYSATYARSAYRDENEASDGNAYYGFRVVVELPAPLAGTSPAATGAALSPYEILTSPDYEWTPPENLGPAVNTQHAQGYPALSADGLRLIYHSFVAGGSGLYEATRANVAEPFGRSEPLGPEFGGDNSAGFGTALSGDGLTLLFGSPRPGGPRGESSINLWQATRPTPASPFAKPACLTTLSSAELDGAPSVSSDGLTVWFRSDRPKSLSRQGGYWTSRRASLAVEFEPPAPFELPLVPGAAGYGHVAGIAISADQRVLLFSPKMDGVVEHDLYLSARPTPQEPFGAPVNLGPAINSATMDVQPTLSADGTILVFSSNRPGGVGEYDLWMTRRVRKATPSVGDYALDFDGVDDLVRIQNYQYVAPSPLTFEAVVAARPPRSQVDALIFAAGSGSNGPRLVCSSRSWSFIYPASPANGSVYAGSDSPVEFGSAVHLAGVWDGREVRLYVDGKKQRQTATPTLRPLDPASVVLGRIGGGGIHGRLQEVRISKVARYTTDFVPDHRFDADDDTEVLYHFDEGAGDVLHDASGHGRDGRIVGAAWVRADGSAIVLPSPPAGAGLKQLAYLDPAFRAWVEATRKLPAERQLEEVSKKLMELNPGFDGKLTGYGTAANNNPPRVVNGVVTEIGFNADAVADLSPVRALSGLTKLLCAGNPGRTGRLADVSPLAGLKLSSLNCNDTAVADLSPLAGMPLKALSCMQTQVSDLTPLAGMPLIDVRIAKTPVSNLAPLRGMKLGILYCHNTRVSDLSPLSGMPLTSLNCSETQVADLTPLKGMQITSLWCHDIPVSDLTPLAGMPLKSLRFTPANIARGIEVIRAMTTLKDLGLKHQTTGPGVYTPAEFWKKYDAGEFGKPPAKPLAYLDPAFQQWVEATQKLPVEKQLEEVSKKLIELNPGFDGKLTGFRFNQTPLPLVTQDVVTEVGFVTDQVSDISPVRAFPGLTGLGCEGEAALSGSLTDLSPLTGLPLKKLLINGNTNLSNLAPLQGMQLTYFESNYTAVTDFAVLQGMPLEYLHTGNATVADLSFVQGMPLEIFYTNGTFSDLSPLRGMPLRHLSIRSSQATDLSPLKGMPLGRLGLESCPLSDLSPLAECKQLTTLFVKKTQVTAAGVAALQKALPNCKVEWDDPATAQTAPPAGTPAAATTPAPAAATPPSPPAGEGSGVRGPTPAATAPPTEK